MFKDILQRHKTDNKFNLANALLEIEDRLIALEEGIMFFANWYNKTQRTDILLPDYMKEKDDQYIASEALEAIKKLKDGQ